MLIPPTAALAFSLSFQQDWKEGFVRPLCARTGLINYVAAKCVICALLSVLAVFLGRMAFVLIASLRWPLYNPAEDAHHASSACGALLLSGQPMLFMLAKSLLYAIPACVYALLALAVSAFVADRFIIVLSPILLEFTQDFMSSFSKLGFRFLDIELAESYAAPGIALGTLFLRAAPLALLLGAAFAWRARGRVRYGGNA